MNSPFGNTRFIPPESQEINSRYDQNAADVAQMVNAMGYDNKAFCKSMTNCHRTLQQSFTRLCLEWIKTCASEDYRYDGRNEDSHVVCDQIMQVAKSFVEGGVRYI